MLKLASLPLLLALAGIAQAAPVPIDAATRAAAVEELARKLTDRYVFPEVGQRMAADLRGRLARGEFNQTDMESFGTALTDAMRALSHDKHLGVRYSAEPLPADPPRNGDPAPKLQPSQRAAADAFGRRINYGFEKVERLTGNVGYLDLRMFFNPELAQDTASAAMHLVANADALIIDLRQNGGGSPDMVRWISSYLFDDKVHLNDLYWRDLHETRQYWTDPSVPGRHYGGKKPIYVLTSSETFSGAEEFSYNLKNLKRATIVGETTGGGANPGRGLRISEHLSCFIPTGRAINPITKTNWEGTGVTPDIAVARSQALNTAYALALKEIVARTTDPDERAEFEKKLAEVQAALR